MNTCFSNARKNAIPLLLLEQNDFDEWLEQQSELTQNLADTQQFQAKSQQYFLQTNAKGLLEQVVVGVGDGSDLWPIAALPNKLPEAVYRFADETPDNVQELSAIFWGYGSYQFGAYKDDTKTLPKLFLAKKQAAFIDELTKSMHLVRHMINMPPNDMGPAELAAVFEDIAEEFGAEFEQWVDEELLEQNFPMIYAVGAGSDRQPRLLQMTYGDPSHFKLTLVGKGVCFDSGGLDLKTANGMLLMKKDMGGAAHVLGLARLIMAMKLPVHLQVLIPAVENSVSGFSYRPGDILIARNGLSVEITNTDAEGRLVLADALVKACESEPDLIIDFATLTGAARVALGPDIAVLMTDEQELTAGVCEAAQATADPVWPLPLFDDYKRYLKSSVAHCQNSALSGYAGAITAGLFLRDFVDDEIPWMHFDINGWHPDSRPGRPKGAAVQGLRAVFEFVSSRLG